MVQIPQRENRRLLVGVTGIILFFILCCVGGVVARPNNFRVAGSAMSPALEDGQFVLASSFPYMFVSPQRGEVIVFGYPKDPRKKFVERIIALPGETVQVREGKVWINGKLLYEPQSVTAANYDWGPMTVGENEYFVLGDNRNRSSDSHVWGMLPAQNINAKAWMTYWPPDKWGFVR